uniref:Cytochrome c oxidase subunit 4 n=1 Tax=Panagrellus redivivus TaxID=6233 RepID=A0A7E4W8Z0_PANRE
MSLSKSVLLPRLAVNAVISRAIQTTAKAQSGHHIEYYWGHERAAGREIVGHGVSGEPTYQDRLDYWYPALRFRVDDATISPLRQKEKSDWKNLTPEEKKLLYRYSFKQTLAEFEAPNGYWKLIASICFSVLSLATFYAVLLNHFVYPAIPPTFDNDYKEAAVERMLVLEKGQFLGPAKYYDYENNRWKK